MLIMSSITIFQTRSRIMCIVLDERHEEMQKEHLSGNFFAISLQHPLKSF